MKISFDPTCDTFLKALFDSGIHSDLGQLDVRLGLEQILDDPDYRPEAEARWAADVPSTIDPGPDSSLEKFLAVTSRHSELTVDQVRIGLEAIIDTPLFMEEARDRWARYDANPWPTQVVMDLGANS